MPSDEPLNNKNTTFPVYLTEKEAADLLKLSIRTLQQWRYKKKGPPYIKLGSMNGKSHVIYDRDELMDHQPAARKTSPEKPALQHPVYLTEEETAGLLKLSVRVFQQRRCRGEGPPFVKVRGLGGKVARIRYRLDVLKEWVSSRQVHTFDEVNDHGLNPMPSDFERHASRSTVVRKITGEQGVNVKVTELEPEDFQGFPGMG